jgi:large subunit ribosomal protein L25
MAEAVKLTTKDRSGHGTRHARRLRRSGQVPAVLYGHGEETLSLSLPADDLHKAIRHGARVVDLEHAGKTEKALIRDLQWDPLGHDILHVDFFRVSEHERILVDVRLELRGTAIGTAGGAGALDQPLHNLRIECPALSVPEVIRVNIAELQLNQALHVKDLVVPPGVVVKNDPEAIVVQVRPVVVEAAPTPAAATPAAEQAEPELIGRQKAAAEEEEPEKK